MTSISKKCRTLRLAIAGSALTLLSSCASQMENSEKGFEEILSRGGRVVLTGWLRVKGEAVIYADHKHMRDQALYPHCVSGVFERHEASRISSLDLQRVVVIGTVFEYGSLAYEDSAVIPRRVLQGSIVSNWCLGDKVLLLEEIQRSP